MIIAVGIKKGGTGKSTAATNLAVMRSAAGRSLLLVDTDTGDTPASTFWCAIRNEAKTEPKIYSAQMTGRLHSAVENMSEKFDDIIIDLAGRDNEEMRSAMLVAQKFIIPVYPGQFDVWSTTAMVKLLKEAHPYNPGMKAIMYINRSSTNPSIRETEEVISVIQNEILKGMDVPNLRLTNVVVRDRIAFRRAARDGLGVSELKPSDQKAVDEISSLFHEVYHVQN